MENLLGLFDAIYRYFILPIVIGVWWLVRKITGLEQEIEVMKKDADAREIALKAEFRVLEATLQGQINTSSAHHAATQLQQQQMLAKLESIEAHLRETRVIKA